MSEESIEAVKHGREAEHLLKNPAFDRAIKSMEEKYVRDLVGSKWMQRRLREKIYDRLKLLNGLKENIRYEIDTGKLYKKRLEAK